MKKQAEFQEKLMIIIPLGLAVLALCGLFFYIFTKGSTSGIL
jgi:flagellar basal body-associated protein FliL